MFTGEIPHTCRVLIVEDNIDLCTVFRAMLKKVCHFHVENTLKGALSYLADHRPTVMFLDNNLPDGSGISSIATIRDKHPQANIVVMTADATEGLAEKALAAGAARFLPKPFSATMLKEVIKTACLRSRG